MVKLPGGKTTNDPNVHSTQDAIKKYGNGAEGISGQTRETTNGRLVKFANKGSKDPKWWSYADDYSNQLPSGKSLDYAPMGDTRGAQQFVDFMNTAIPMILSFGAGTGETLVARGAEALESGGGEAIEGIYEFTAASGKTYVGQSGNIFERIAQHLASGKLLPEDLSTLRTTEVLGGKTAREIAEQLRINGLGGIENLENIRNPIGVARQYLLPLIP